MKTMNEVVKKKQQLTPMSQLVRHDQLTPMNQLVGPNRFTPVSQMIKKGHDQLTPMSQLVGPNKISYRNVQENREGQLHGIQENLEVHSPNSVQKIFDKARGKYRV